MPSVVLKTNTLKNLLALFEEEAVLENFRLGDTWHPLSGFVDETIFPPKPRVKDLAKTDYDFKGLVEFSATIGKVQVQLTSHEPKLVFNISSDAKTLVQLEHLIIEKNTWSPGKYKLIKKF